MAGKRHREPIEPISSSPHYLADAPIIGIWKILGALTFAVSGVPRLKEWAYAGMFFDITGAFLSHAMVGDGTIHLIETGSIVLLVVASWALRPASRTLGNFTFSKVSFASRQPVLSEG